MRPSPPELFVSVVCAAAVLVLALLAATPIEAQTSASACTEAQCTALASARKFCPGFGQNAAPFACANPGDTFGGCNASDTFWNRQNCGQSGCDTRICHWNAIVPHGTPATADRTLTFVNRCPFNIRLGYVGGVVKSAAAANITCTSDADCPSGSNSVCLQSEEGVKSCYWKMPSSFDNARNLTSGARSSVTLNNRYAPFVDNIQIKWSGNVWAHSQCDARFENCKTAVCPANGCAPNVGPTGAVTFAEFTLQNNSQDFFDLSAINGVNLPIQMEASVGSGQEQVFGPPGAPGSFWCTPAGSPRAVGKLKGSSWNVGANAPAANLVFYRNVDPTGFGDECTSDGDCSGGSVCGLVAQKGDKPPELQCGKLVAWMTAAEICTLSEKSKFSNVDCSAAVAGFPDKPTQADVLLCRAGSAAGSGPGTFGNSCYSHDATDNCCGCETWAGLESTEECRRNNPAWRRIALPWLEPVKQAVPTVYAYQFDDPTSTFNCYTQKTRTPFQPTPQIANETSYTFTFCPDGLNVPAMQ